MMSRPPYVWPYPGNIALSQPFLLDSVKASPSACRIREKLVGKGDLSLCTFTLSRSNLVLLSTTEIVQSWCKYIPVLLPYKSITCLNTCTAFRTTSTCLIICMKCLKLWKLVCVRVMPFWMISISCYHGSWPTSLTTYWQVFGPKAPAEWLICNSGLGLQLMFSLIIKWCDDWYFDSSFCPSLGSINSVAQTYLHTVTAVSPIMHFWQEKNTNIIVTIVTSIWWSSFNA